MKILWVKAGGLVPLDTGGKIRSYHILRSLSRRHEVTLFTFYAEHPNDCHSDLDKVFARVIRHPLALPPRKSLGALIQYARTMLDKQPHQIGKYCGPRVSASLLRLVESERFDVIVCDFLVAAGVIPWHVNCPKVLFTHNVEALIWQRHYEVTRNPFWKMIYWREYSATERAERRYIEMADHILTVSTSDRDLFAQLVKPSKITVIPTGVDLNFFQPSEQEHANTLVFTGSMDYAPNEDGVLYFARDIFPLIRKRIPSAALIVVGRRPSKHLLDLADKTKGIEVTGTVDDIRPYVLRGSVYIVPLRVGSGTRLKIFEAMAMGKAVVSTSVGAEGLPVHPGRDIILADTPDEFARAVVSLLGDRHLRSEMGRAARELVARHHGWESVGEQFELALESLISSRTQETREAIGVGGHVTFSAE